MRHIAAALGTLALIAALTLCNSGRMTARLDAVDAALAAAQEAGEAETLAAARQLWDGLSLWLHATQPHPAMDAVNTALKRAESYRAEGKTAELRAELAAARDAVRTLRDRERFSLENLL